MAIDQARDEGDEFTYWLLDNYDVLPPETSGAQRTVTMETLRQNYNRAYPRRQLNREEIRERLGAVPAHVMPVYNGRRNLVAVRPKPVAYAG